MDASYYRVSVVCDTMEFKIISLSPPLVWSTPLAFPGRCGICMHQHSRSDIRKKKVTLHILTHGAMWGCGLTYLVVSFNDKTRDTRGRNVTIRIEIWTTNVRSLGFGDIRECVILWGLILRSVRCTCFPIKHNGKKFDPIALMAVHGPPKVKLWDPDVACHVTMLELHIQTYMWRSRWKLLLRLPPYVCPKHVAFS